MSIPETKMSEAYEGVSVKFMFRTIKFPITRIHLEVIWGEPNVNQLRGPQSAKIKLGHADQKTVCSYTPSNPHASYATTNKGRTCNPGLEGGTDPFLSTIFRPIAKTDCNSKRSFRAIWLISFFSRYRSRTFDSNASRVTPQSWPLSVHGSAIIFADSANLPTQTWSSGMTAKLKTTFFC